MGGDPERFALLHEERTELQGLGQGLGQEQVSSRRIRAMFDLYNVFNASTVLDSNGRYGGSYLRPIAVMGGRTIKLAGQVDF